MNCLETTVANLCTFSALVASSIAQHPLLPHGWEEWASAVQLVGAGLGGLLYLHLLLRRVARWRRLRNRRTK